MKRPCFPVPRCWTDLYGQHGVYASVPCILGAAGVEEVIELTLSRGEAEGFAKSCAIIREHCEKL